MKTSLPYRFMFIALLLCAHVITSSQLLANDAKPNIVLFIADDISWNDLGVAGHPTIKTPNIDKLAAKGLRFTNAYLTISSCSPSRCSIITSRYPHNTGAPELHTTLPAGHVVFPRLLKDAGYYTMLSGKHHMGNSVNHGFSKVSKGKGPGKEGDWVSLLEKRPKDKPFFCWYASTDAHRDWAINDDAPKYKSEDVVVPPYLIDGKKTREDLTGYYHEVSRFDHYIGEVTKELAKQDVLKNTVIIVMADNGRPFPRCKTRLYDSGIKTPFIVHYPDGVKAGTTASLISSIDVGSTIVDLAGLKPNERMQGVSFLPILKNHKAVTRDVVFAEHNWHVYRNHERMVRTGDWLYIRNNFPDQQNLCVEAYKGGAGIELWEMHKTGKLTAAQRNVFWNPCPKEELYHVGKDASQINNVAADPKHAKTIAQMRELLANWSKETADTIPANPTPHRDAPPGDSPRDRKNFKRGEMPGESSGAIKVNAKGPLRFKS